MLRSLLRARSSIDAVFWVDVAWLLQIMLRKKRYVCVLRGLGRATRNKLGFWVPLVIVSPRFGVLVLSSASGNIYNLAFLDCLAHRSRNVGSVDP